MRKMTLITLFCALLLNNSFVNASDSTCKFGKETITDPLCYGPTNLAETTVTGKMLVAGEFKADHSTLEGIEVAGVANMNDSNVKGNTHLMGPLSATRSTFDGNLSIDSDQTALESSTVNGSVTVNSNEADPVLELSCGTTITGGITFLGKKGLVKKTKDSTIEGKVINGTIESFVSNKKCVLPKMTVKALDQIIDGDDFESA